MYYVSNYIFNIYSSFWWSIAILKVICKGRLSELLSLQKISLYPIRLVDTWGALIQSKAKCWSFVQLLIIKFLTQDESKRFSACQHAAAAILNVGFKRRHQMDKLRLENQMLPLFGTFCLVQRNSIIELKHIRAFRLILCFICWLFGQRQLTFDIRILWVRTQTMGEHTYLARRSTMITKVVPLGWGLSIAPRLGWPLRLPQTWVTRARNFW